MTTGPKLWMSVCLLFFCLAAYSQDIEHPSVISFEQDIPGFVAASPGSAVRISSRHYKDGEKSLEWSWNGTGSLFFNAPVGFQPFRPNAEDQSISTFVFWIYNEKAIDQKLKFYFQTDGKTNCSFEYSLNFTGWRGAWVAFERDMEGTPAEGMNRLEIQAPPMPTGRLFFDQMILSVAADSRWHTADYQVPFVNRTTQNHWLQLYNSSQYQFDLPVAQQITTEEISQIREIEARFENEVNLPLEISPARFRKLKERFDGYHITETDSGITGKSVWFTRYSEVFQKLDVEWQGFYVKHQKEVQAYSELMYELARGYRSCPDPRWRDELKQMFLLMVRHLFDQGWQEGSGMGMLHHLGYGLRNYYPALFLMRAELEEAGLAVPAQKAMEWFSGVGEVKKAPETSGISIDAFNTSVMGRLASILMLPDGPEKVTWLRSFSRYIDNGLQLADGLEDSFKADGSIFHHANHYPAYAIGGLDGAVNMVSFLNNTGFEVSRTGHRNLQKALLQFRLYCNLKQWPLSISGRHPRGTGELVPWHFAKLALCGTPDKSSEIDSELAGAYLRLAAFDGEDEYKKIFAAKGIQAEPAPQGNWAMNYASLGIHRRGEWLATVRGHSRYIWAAEIYLNANWYGRYLAHGYLQVMGGGKPVTNLGSGYQHNGWDWNRWPGTTIIHLPFDQLKADVRNVDRFSGYEEMLFSDEAFAGGLSFQQQQGMYAFKLHEHDKYNGSHRALKSYFFFDNRIVCLGSNISNNNADFPTETVLFQNVLPKRGNALTIGGKKITGFPFHTRLEKPEAAWLSDNQQISYFISAGNDAVSVEKKHQYSHDQSTQKLTEGDFMSAVIQHGKAPKDAAYEYLMCVQPEKRELKELNRLWATGSKPYQVLQKDARAHIVYDFATRITAYALFEANDSVAHGVVRAATAPVMVMTRADADELQLSVCDPDLHLYEGPADVTLDENGKRIERSIYSYPWYHHPSNPSRALIRLDGQWQLKQASEFFRIVNTGGGTTTLEVSFHDGLTRETTLVRANGQ